MVGTTTDSLTMLGSELGEYFVKINVSNVSYGFRWGLVIIYGDTQPTGKSKFLVELVHLLTVPKILCLSYLKLTREASDRNKLRG